MTERYKTAGYGAMVASDSGPWVSWKDHETLRAQLAAVTTERDRVTFERESLRMERDACESNRVRDNAFLIGRAEAAEAEVARLRAALEGSRPRSTPEEVREEARLNNGMFPLAPEKS